MTRGLTRATSSPNAALDVLVAPSASEAASDSRRNDRREGEGSDRGAFMAAGVDGSRIRVRRPVYTRVVRLLTAQFPIPARRPGACDPHESPVASSNGAAIAP